MYKIYNDGSYSICVSEYVDQHIIICKRNGYKINIFLFKDMEHIYFKAYNKKELIYNKRMTSLRGPLNTEKKVKNFLLSHVYINNVDIQLMIINAVNIFYENL